MNWKHWNWLDGFILPVALSIMRVCTLWLWLVLLQRFLMPSYQGPLLSAYGMTAVILASLFLTRWSVRWLRPIMRARILVAITGLLIIFWLLWAQLYQSQFVLWDAAWLRTWGQEMLFWQNELPPAYLLLFATIYLWLRGIIDGSRTLSHVDAAAAFITGSLSMIVFLFFVNLDTQPPPTQTSALIFIFFTMALVALSLSSLKRGRTHETLLSTAVANLHLNRYWVSSAFTVIAVLLVLGLILSAIIAPESLQQILGWAGQAVLELLLLVIKIISLILYPVLLLLSWLVTNAFRLLSSREYLEISQFDEELRSQPEEMTRQIEPAIQQLPDEIRWLALGLAVLGIALLFALILRRLRDDDNLDIRETREFIFSKALLLAQLAQLRPSWLNKTTLSQIFLSLHGEIDTRRAIRALYQKLLALAHEQGLPRPIANTPVEYSYSLAQSFSRHAREALATITHNYHQARYAEEPPTMTQVEETERAWAQLQSDGLGKERK
jgi:hypothetical protein